MANGTFDPHAPYLSYAIGSFLFLRTDISLSLTSYGLTQSIRIAIRRKNSE
jgi:hypothetical protein